MGARPPRKPKRGKKKAKRWFRKGARRSPQPFMGLGGGASGWVKLLPSEEQRKCSRVEWRAIWSRINAAVKKGE